MAVSTPELARPGWEKTPGERHRAERGEHEHDGQGQPGVTDPVGDERLLGRHGRGRLVLPEPDQQVRGQADTLPAGVQHQVVVGQHEQQHGGQEQVHVAEEPAPARVVSHVADREDVDQRADPRDQQHEADRQLVQLQRHVHLERADRDPGVQVQVPAALTARVAEHRGEGDHRVHERGQRHGHAQQVTPAVGPLSADQQYYRAEQREREQQPRRPLHADRGQRGLHAGRGRVRNRK
jgi:hypothetical protein